MIEVLKPGFHSLIQDSGRFGYQEFGMPVSGVLDVDSYRLSNWLVGNLLTTEVLEIVLVGPVLRFLVDTFIGITGANMHPQIDGVKVDLNKTLYIKKGSVLSFGNLENGCRCYLSVAGGFGVLEEMNSRSTYSYANLGGVDGRALVKGDSFDVFSSQEIEVKTVPSEFGLNQYSSMPVRVIAGPEFCLFSKKDLVGFFNNEFVVGANSNRMGVRLNGFSLNVPDLEMISSGVVNGTIQVPPNGEPIVLLTEAQTTGGYPRIANVIKSDLSIMAQQKPGDKIRFRRVSLEEAQANFSNKERRYQELNS